MTEKDLRARMNVFKIGYGIWKVQVKYRKVIITCKTYNSLAVDAMNSEGQTGSFYTTPKQGLVALYRECLVKNNLRDTY